MISSVRSTHVEHDSSSKVKKNLRREVKLALGGRQ